jgi:hypothetical protein
VRATVPPGRGPRTALTTPSGPRRTGLDLDTRPRSSSEVQFVAACRERNPGADVREGSAEELPWADGTFDATLFWCATASAWFRRSAHRHSRPNDTAR